MIRLFLFASVLAFGQAPSFEVAAIKPPIPDSRLLRVAFQPGGHLVADNVSLRTLIEDAYQILPFQLTGGPAWLDSRKFSINATANEAATPDQMRLMLRTLLEERFQLKVHYEKRELPIYRMVLAATGKLGPQLRRTEADCAGAPVDPFRGITPGQSYPCGYFGPSPAVNLDSGRAYQAIRGLTLEDFTLRLYPYLGRRVIDGTRLSGYFDADFEFTAEIVMPPPPPGQPNPYDGRVLPSIFSVLPQQLGLKLESQRGTVDILVIDHAEHPSDN